MGWGFFYTYIGKSSAHQCTVGKIVWLNNSQVRSNEQQHQGAYPFLAALSHRVWWITLNKTKKGIEFFTHNLLLASLVHWLNSDFYLLKILCREFFFLNYKLPLWEFKWIFISDHGELLGQISFLLKESMSEWGLLNPLVVVRTTHIAQEFKS